MAIKGNFSDERITELHTKTIDFVTDLSRELQLPLAVVIGVLENIKHELQHEFTPIDSVHINY